MLHFFPQFFFKNLRWLSASYRRENVQYWSTVRIRNNMNKGQASCTFLYLSNPPGCLAMACMIYWLSPAHRTLLMILLVCISYETAYPPCGLQPPWTPQGLWVDCRAQCVTAWLLHLPVPSSSVPLKVFILIHTNKIQLKYLADCGIFYSLTIHSISKTWFTDTLQNIAGQELVCF